MSSPRVGHLLRRPSEVGLSTASADDRANVLGVCVHAINIGLAADRIESALAKGEKGYVCVTGVHGVMEAQNDLEFKNILNRAMLTVPDGMPTVWVGKLQGFRNMKRVFGPDLMTEVCACSVEKGYKHFLLRRRTRCSGTIEMQPDLEVSRHSYCGNPHSTVPSIDQGRVRAIGGDDR